MAAETAPRGNEKVGIAIAAALHVLAIGLLSVQWTAGDRRFDNPPMEVDLVAETAPQSTALVISESPPAARLGEEDAVDIAAPEPVPAPPVPQPIERPTAAPAPKQVAKPVPTPPRKTPPAAAKATPKPAPKTAPPKKATAGPTGRLDGIFDGLSKSQPKAPASKGAPAAAVGAEVRQAIETSIKAAVKPHWDRCKLSGVDVDQLTTIVRFRLTQSGDLAGFTSVSTTGENDSNKFQVARHQECAKKAVELAAPFRLDPQYFSEWQNRKLEFFKR